jgi:hypothetical protein
MLYYNQRVLLLLVLGNRDSGFTAADVAKSRLFIKPAFCLYMLS